jgi:hypothetical protein
MNNTMYFSDRAVSVYKILVNLSQHEYDHGTQVYAETMPETTAKNVLWYWWHIKMFNY